MLLTWVAIAAGVGAIAVAARWVVRRFDSLGRRRPFPRYSVALLAVLAIVAAIPGIVRAREEHRLDKVASALVGAHVRVHCQSLGGSFVDATADLGYVRFGPDGVPERSTVIKHDQCVDLASYLSSSKHRPSQDQVVAVHVLSHEAMHMAGITSESQAECAAMQRDAKTARLLGAEPADARALASQYWLTVYPHMPDVYRTGACAPGGSLDEGLGDGPW